MIALAALSVLGASATAITYLVTQPRDAVALASIEQAPAPPVFYAVDPFTVTLNTDISERLLHVGLVFRINDASARQRLDAYLPIIRSQVLLLLAEQNAEQVQTGAGKRQLAADIKRTANAVVPDTQRAPVDDVLFNAFVVQ